MPEQYAGHRTAGDHGVMDPEQALSPIRINGHLGATPAVPRSRPWRRPGRGARRAHRAPGPIGAVRRARRDRGARPGPLLEVRQLTRYESKGQRPPIRKDVGVPAGGRSTPVSEDSSRAAWLRKQAPTSATPTRCWPGSSTSGRLRPGAWRAQLPAMDLFGALLFQVAGQQLSVAATRRILGRIQAPFGGRLPAPAELRPPPLGAGEAGPSWSRSARARPGRAPHARTAGPGRAEHPARRRADGRADRHPRDRPLDRAGRPARRAGPGGRRAAGRPRAAKAVQAAYRLDHRPSEQEVLDIAEKWRPYRSLATSYLSRAAFEPAERLRGPDRASHRTLSGTSLRLWTQPSSSAIVTPGSIP